VTARTVLPPVITGVLAVIAIVLAATSDSVLLAMAGGALVVLTAILALGPLIARLVFRVPPRR
jgi:hypothetical protein